MTRLAPWTRSIAPPMPLTIFPGPIQLAKSPVTETYIPPRIATSMWPPRIIAKLVGESKNDAPLMTVTVSFPAGLETLDTFRCNVPKQLRPPDLGAWPVHGAAPEPRPVSYTHL